MKLKLTIAHRDQHRDAAIVGDSLATAGALADRIQHELGSAMAEGPTARSLIIRRPGAPDRVVGAEQPLGETGIRSGDTVSVTAAPPAMRDEQPAVGTLHVVNGPDAPAQFALHGGTNYIGRDRGVDIRLSDPLVSKRHAKINISDVVQVVDDGSSNGVLIGEQLVDRAVLRPGARLTLGDTEITVTLTGAKAVDDEAHEVAFNRSPRLAPVYEGVELKAPEPPKPTQKQRFPLISLLAPILMAGMIYSVTRNPMSLMFVALSPMLMIGNWFEGRRAAKRAFRQDLERYREALLDLSVQLQANADVERAARRAEYPSAAEIEAATRDMNDLLWTRRPEHEDFLTCRLGLGTQPSRNTVEMPRSNDTPPELWRELVDVVGQFSLVDRVPVVARLDEVGNIGVCGPASLSQPVLANVVGQFVALHSPAELVMASIAGETAEAWDWMKWLPHTTSEFSPIETPHLANNASEANALVSAIEGVVDQRSAERDNESAVLPAVLVVIADDAPIERSRLVQLAERGPAQRVHVIWHAPSRQRLPAACRIFVETTPAADLQFAGVVPGGESIPDLEPESIHPPDIEALARRLAPVADSGVRADDQTDLPRSVSFLELAGVELGDDAALVIDSWRSNNALPPEPDAPKPKRDNTLRALVGHAAAGPMHLDLRTQGPHALVGGTTGAGKSEFLQSWILGMASMHSPSRVTFLFVDYKGGSAFADCVELPHCVGLVTDLSPHLVRRALTSLNAELLYREHILNGKKAKDLFELEKRNDPEAPPSLVIVVDEFAALVHEVPEFVDGVVNVAQRGRSLGLNLILATQRPAGVIKDNLRANTNLRVALRMADEADSDDVVGSKLAATFDPSLPGRGVVKTGPGRLSLFQSAYAGGSTTGEPPRPNIEIRNLAFGHGALWEEPTEEAPKQTGPGVPTDIKRLVSTISAAAAQAGIEEPRRPWLDELAPTYNLELLPSNRTDSELVFGVADEPRTQSQPPVAFFPDVEGNMAVYGAGGTGKSALLRSMAVAAAQGYARGGPTHVYGLDFGSRALQTLEVLPHVGSIISGDDEQRVQRLLRTLREKVDERAEQFSAVEAGTIEEYRTHANKPDEARILVLVDNVGAFRTAYEGTPVLNTYWEMFQALAADGRSVGVHFVVSADRPGAVSTSLRSAIQQQLVFRLANESDYFSVDVRPDGYSATSPPGRGYYGEQEVQVAVLGGKSNVALQAAELRKLAATMQRAGFAPARPIASLDEYIALDSLPEQVNGRPTLGVWDQRLEPIGFEPSGTFLVAGPPLSGRTTTVATIATQLRRARPKMKLAYFGQRRSQLHGVVDWDCSATDPLQIADLATDMLADVETADPGGWGIIIESVAELLNSDADPPLQKLLKVARAGDQFVLAEGETSSLTGSWPLLQAVKVNRTGIVLQPDQMDGESLLRTPFPRVARRDFPLGRGMFVVGGKWYLVQVAIEE